jgi:hypothetical protein
MRLITCEGAQLSGGKVDGCVGCVQYSSQDQLARGPGGITLQHLLDTGWFLVVDVVDAAQRPKH